jgi:hypothetical protein
VVTEGLIPVRTRELIFHTGDQAGQELAIEINWRGDVEASIVSDEEPEARTVKLDNEQIEWLRDALTELLNRVTRPNPSAVDHG